MYRTCFRVALVACFRLVIVGLALSYAQFASAQYAIIDLGSLGGLPISHGQGINALGHVTGNAYTASNNSHAFLYDGTMHDLGTLGGSFSRGYDINNFGQVTGESYTSSQSISHAFLYDGTTMHDLGTLGGTRSVGRAINNFGKVAGESYIRINGINQTHAFLYDGTTMHDLGTLYGFGNSLGLGINDSGLVTGFSSASGGSHAFLYDGTMHDLGTLGGTTSVGRAINNAGQVVGDSSIPGDTYRLRAFFYDGVMHDLGTLGGSSSGSLGLNNLGQVVGESYFSMDSTELHAFVYDNVNGMRDLNDLIDPLLDWELVSASAINDSGWITGFGRINNQQHAFLLVPIPEPGTISLIGFASVGLLWRVRRKSKI